MAAVCYDRIVVSVEKFGVDSRECLERLFGKSDAEIKAKKNGVLRDWFQRSSVYSFGFVLVEARFIGLEGNRFTHPTF